LGFLFSLLRLHLPVGILHAMDYLPVPYVRAQSLLSDIIPSLGSLEGERFGLLLAKDDREAKHVLKAFEGNKTLVSWCPPCGGNCFCLDGEVRQGEGGEKVEVKLLSTAFSHGWRPVSMALCDRNGLMVPCDSSCRPLIHMMCGLDVVYADESIAVVEKPEGLLSVPGNGPDKQDCVVNRLKRLFPHCLFQPSVHRLDMDTSGLLVYGLTKEAQANLSVQFAKGEVHKEYVALVDGVLEDDGGEIDLSIRPDWEHRPYQMYDPEGGKKAVTEWEKLDVESLPDGRKVTRVRFLPRTGRTHQLRVHSALSQGLGHPIVGDRLYGERKEGERLMLHAGVLCFRHPETGKMMEFDSRAPF